MDIWKVSGLSLLPGLGIFLGSLFAEKIDLSERTTSAALHWAAGMILSVVSIQIMPEVMGAKPIWPVIVAVLAGGLTGILVDLIIDKKIPGKGKWTILMAVTVDMFSDGIAIGTSANISKDFVFMMVLGLFIGDFPEGLVNTTTFKEQKTSRFFRIMISAGLGAVCVISAIGAFTISKNQSENFKYILIAFTAGMYIRAAVEDLIRKSHSKTGKTVLNQCAFILGFVTYMVGNVVFAH